MIGHYGGGIAWYPAGLGRLRCARVSKDFDPEAFHRGGGRLKRDDERGWGRRRTSLPCQIEVWIYMGETVEE